MTRIEELATRIIDIDFYGARDAGETVETIADQIKNDPAEIIAFLLDTIEDLQEGE